MEVDSEVDELITVVQLFRHGSRNPVKTFNNMLRKNIFDPDDWGELTKEGKLEIYNLAPVIRRRYGSLLGPKYSKKYFKIFSTASDRVLMSAQLFTAGLYPPTPNEIWHEDLLWQPIPVFEIPSTVLGCRPIDHIVPGYRKEVREIEREMLENYGKKLGINDYISANIGEKVPDFMNMAIFIDVCMIAEDLGLELQPWLRKIYPDPIKELYTEYVRMLVGTTYRKRMYMGGFFYQFIRHMEQKIANQPVPNLVTYFGHDTNIVGLLQTLSTEKYEYPLGGSNISIELWKKRNGDFVVRTYYAPCPAAISEPILVKMSGGRTVCKFEDFKEMVKEFMISEEDIELEIRK